MNLFSKIFGSPVSGINPVEAREKLSQKDRPYLLDVRQPEEFRTGHINGARLIPLDTLRSRMDELPKSKEIICVCQTGSRSTSATRQLATAGFSVTNLNGGMAAWMRAGLPVKKGSE